MNFLAILLALGIERVFPQGTALGESRLLGGALSVVKRLGRSGDITPMPWLLTVVAVMLTLALDRWLQGMLVQPVFGAAVLLLCLGPRDLSDDVQRLVAARRRGDVAEIERLSRSLQSGPAPDESHRNLIGALFIQSHERLFGVLLWFMALGPAAAVAYRLASRLPTLLEKAGFSAGTLQAATHLHALLAWVPTRLTAGLFALAGSMDDALAAWRRVGELHYNGAWRSHSWAVLAEVGAGALAMEEENGAVVVTADLSMALGEVLRMQTRALLVLLAGFAVYAGGTLS